ncbi:MAG: hypothetical protein C4576_06795 [Desulfobacteraceae bacterium]|nr:MAG: hypothetical protein C4576_06795 [Desulfobacteraceae bacterium]
MDASFGPFWMTRKEEMFSVEGTIPGVLEIARRKWPDKEAVVYRDQRINFAKLKELSDIAAKGFIAIGVNPGDHVGFIMGNYPQFVWLQFGVIAVGAKVVPINVSLKADEIKFILQTAEITTLIINDHFRDIDYLTILGEMIPKYCEYEPGEVNDPSLPRLRNIIIFDSGGSSSSNVFTVDQLMDLGRQRLEGRSAPKPEPSDYAFIMFTSGTTAFPKGAIQTHRAILTGGYYSGKALSLDSTDKYLCVSPFYHVAGLVTGLYSCLVHGAALHLMEFFDADEAAQTIAREKITAGWGLGVMFLRIIESARRLGLDISHLKKALIPTGGNTFEKVVKELQLEVATNSYALTEGAGPVSIMLPDDRNWEKRRNSQGRALPGIEVRIIDRKTGTRLPPGNVGEICFRGWSNILGYYNMPEETSAAADREGFFHTQDMGEVDEEGYLYYRGRYKHIIKTGGENVSQLEVETFLEDKTPWVKRAGVVGIPDRRWGEAVTALVQLKPNVVVTAEELQNYMKGKIAGFKIPKHILLIEGHEWPLRPTKKLDKQKLRDMALSKLGIVSRD